MASTLITWSSSDSFLILIFVAISLVHSNARNVSRDEYLELRRQLKLLNKPAVKSIKTEYGDIYDCVDVYKQPALNHPLLKNHKIQHAIAYLEGEVYGTRVTMNVWGPLLPDERQYSLGQLWIPNTQNDKLNSIEAGWIADGYKKTGCYNLFCTGFVQVSREVPIGTILEPASTYNGQQKEVVLQAFKDPYTTDWWLTFGKNDIPIGYWPNSLFANSFDKASAVAWGGEVSTPEGSKSPEMGSGHFPDQGFGKASYMKLLKTIDNNNTLRDIPDNVPLYQDVTQCYKVIDGGNLGGEWVRNIYFGGPGGC